MTSSSFSSCVIHLGSDNASLLTMQEAHVSQYIWIGHLDQVLIVRGESSICRTSKQIPAQIILYLEQAGFLEVAKFKFFQIEHILVFAIVEH